MLLLSEDFGKHLMGVEDLLQKHGLLEADVVSYGMRVQQINQQATKFMDEKGPDGSGRDMFLIKDGLLHTNLRWMTNKSQKI